MLMVNVRPVFFALVALATSVAGFAQKQDITINVSGPANVTDSDHVNIGTYTKLGNGTLTLSHLSADLIDVRAGTLLLGGSDMISDTTNMRLSGGTFGTAGNSETLGSLTLAANSSIDFGNGSSILHFDSSAVNIWASGTTLTIANWTGGSDQLYFGSAMSALTEGQVAKIRFLNPNGVSGIFGAAILANGQIVPVPEPETIGFGALLVGSIAVRERKRLAVAWGKLLGA